MSAYSYAPLDNACKEIRLLHIRPSTDKSSDIVCTLQHASLNAQNPPHYETLSYTWGGGPTISFSTTNTSPVMWVDAICINQKDDVEKSSEVPRILQIYQSAFQVCIWLGGESSDSGLAFKHLRQLALQWEIWGSESFITVYRRRARYALMSLCQFLCLLTHISLIIGAKRWKQCLCMMLYYTEIYHSQFISMWTTRLSMLLIIIEILESTLPQWWRATSRTTYALQITPDDDTITALANLFGRSWFTRTWIVQEVTAAKKACFICGPDSMSIESLTDALEYIGYLTYMHASKSPYTRCIYLNFSSFLTTLVKREAPPAFREQQRSLLFLISRFSNLDAQLQQDKVYAFLGLVHETQRVEADYTKSASEVYIETARHLIETSGNLDVLRACLFTGAVENLPSWVPDWTVKQHRSVGDFAHWREQYALSPASSRHLVSLSQNTKTLSQAAGFDLPYDVDDCRYLPVAFS
ncbi:heterokaryon incompatibility protein-domain-containing protein [Xylaria scruposa]|nr:heterokaryon incompatibility protein-domain-containing protein [Xylaria scruposa]